MLTISKRQRLLMSKELDDRTARTLADNIQAELREQVPDVMKPHDRESAFRIIVAIIGTCLENGILDADQLLNLCYIRFILGVDTLKNDAFAYIWNNHLLHPYSKARHLILSFFAINAMRAGA